MVYCDVQQVNMWCGVMCVMCVNIVTTDCFVIVLNSSNLTYEIIIYLSFS